MHEPDDPCFAEEFLGKIMPALIRMGDIRESSILALADQCDTEAHHCPYVDEGERLGHMATILRSWVIDASGPPPSDWHAEQRRKTLRIVTPD